MEHYLNKKSTLLNNRNFNTFLDPIQKRKANKTLKDYFVDNNDKIKKQMLLFQHVDYFKKFEISHPALYHSIKDSFSLATFDLSIDKDISSKTNAENNITLMNFMKINKMVESLYRNLSSSDREKYKIKNLFRYENNLLEDIVFNLFFQSELAFKIETDTYDSLLKVHQKNQVGLIQTILNKFKKKDNDHVLDIESEWKMLIKNINQAENYLQNKNTPPEFYEKILNNCENINAFLIHKLNNAPIQNILNLGKDMHYKLEQVPEFYISLGLFLCATTKMSENFMTVFSKNIENIATSKDKKEAINFMKNYLSIFKDDTSVDNNIDNSQLKMQQAEKKLLDLEGNIHSISDKLKDINETLNHYEEYHHICPSDYLSNLKMNIREKDLQDTMKNISNSEKNIERKRVKI